MKEIKCPHCQAVFTIDESEYSHLLAQVRGQEFEKELSERLHNERALLEEKSKSLLQEKLNEKDSIIQKLQSQVEHVEKEQAYEKKEALSQKDQVIADLEAKLSQVSSEHQLALEKKLSEKDSDILKLQSQIEHVEKEQEFVRKEALTQKDQIIADLEAKLSQISSQSALDLEKQVSAKDKELLELSKKIEMLELENQSRLKEAVASLEKEKNGLENQLRLQEKETELSLATVRSDYEVQLKAANEQVEFYKNFKAQQSTKAIGESLELYAETEFNKVRSYAFPNAQFAKDNELSSRGSKGDYIYREFDKDGIEILSIMFEMKNEADTTKTKHRNSDFFKELDRDRLEKNCEYAVLVTMLEADNDYYNTGIVDVSHEYEKMYVVRPQLFIQIIGILRNASLNALKYKQELALVREQNIDITHFEEDLDVFKNAFAKNYNSASSNFKKAIDEIDKSIKRMEEVKRFLTTSENQLRLANNKLDDVSVKKLTRNNPTMREKFDQLNDSL